MRYLIIVLILLLEVSSQTATAGEKHCSREDAIAADAEAAGLKDWHSAYQSFKRYSHCDDGGIGEGYSESIARLLTENGGHLSALYKLTSKDKNFEKFIIHHVDELMTPEQAKKIYENAQRHCPGEAKKLCKLIVVRLDETKTTSQ